MCERNVPFTLVCYLLSPPFPLSFLLPFSFPPCWFSLSSSCSHLPPLPPSASTLLSLTLLFPSPPLLPPSLSFCPPLSHPLAPFFQSPPRKLCTGTKQRMVLQTRKEGLRAPGCSGYSHTVLRGGGPDAAKLGGC